MVASTGYYEPRRGMRFALAGSFSGRVLAEGRTCTERDYTAAFPHPPAVALGLGIGPMAATPLAAHERTLGVLLVSRRQGKEPFGERETHRLEAIADYASLGLWKTQMLEQAQAANRAKSTFLATMSHELRTPLAALVGYGELLDDEILGPLTSQQSDVLQRMRSVTSHLSAMIEEILTFTSLEEGRETVRPSDFLAAEVVQAVAAVIEPLARQKGLAFAASAPGEPLIVRSDVDKVRQILVNLAGNAVKFTVRGEVRLDVAREGDAVRFRIRDTGIGIAPEDARRLFQPFTQLDSGLTRRHGGTGLGLYISQRLAALLGAEIELESAPGKGSTFSVVLPTSRDSGLGTRG
jgi:signal transduction histidine kinase